MRSPVEQLKEAFLADDHSAVARLLDGNAELRQVLNEPAFNCGMPPLAAAKSCGMVDVMISRGALVDQVAEWWAPGFGVSQMDPAIAQHLVERGAAITIHAAVAIGLINIVREMLERDPALISAKGGDGCEPLHFCTRCDIASLLLEHNANIHVRDEDHASTPAQWRIGDAPDVVRLLLERGAEPDIFMAAAFGDLKLAKTLIAANHDCTAYRIGANHGPFPGIGFEGRGGTIYQWSLGFNLSPHEVALHRDHSDLYESLLEQSTPRTKFLVACTTANRPLAESIFTEHPTILSQLDEDDLMLLPKFCWETNKDIEAVRLMLDLGFPIDTQECNHGCTALHNAAWCGDPELVQLLIERGHPLNIRDPNYNATPLGFALHSCLVAKRHPEGRFAEVISMLLAKGAEFDPQDCPVGDTAIDAVIAQHLGRG